MLDAGDEQRALGRAERVVATVPGAGQTLGEREGEAIGDPQETAQIGGRAYPLERSSASTVPPRKMLTSLRSSERAELRVEACAAGGR